MDRHLFTKLLVMQRSTADPPTLEEELRSDIEEKEHIIEALKTKVTLLKVSLSMSFFTLTSVKCFKCTW